MNTQPITSAIGDVFMWESLVTIPSNVAPNNKDTDRLQVQSDSVFCLLAWGGSTNYDAVAGDFIAVIGAGPAAARTLVSPPFVPNNFQVMIRYNSDQNLMSSPMPQACLCSNGYRAGQQLPYPVLFPPMTTFDFEFYNVARTLQYAADQTTLKPLQITFGLYGVFVPLVDLPAFLKCWPSYACEAYQGAGDWYKKFTGIDFSGL
jgi:hypothetical protein